MAISAFVKWVGAAAVVGGVAAVALSGDGATSTASKVRHGIRFEGCTHFELVDENAWRSFIVDNADEILAAAGMSTLEELAADPESALLRMLAIAFPECDGRFDEATWGAERATWDTTIERIRNGLGALEGAGMLAGLPIDVELVMMTFFADLAGPDEDPDEPIVEPKVPTPEGEGAPVPEDSPLVELADANDFAMAEVAKLVDPIATTRLGTGSMVVLGYNGDWKHAADAKKKADALAKANNDLQVVVFSFARSNAAIGMPDPGQDIAYVATAVDPDGVPMGMPHARMGVATAPAIPDERFALLLDFARNGYPTPEGSILEVLQGNSSKGYTLLLEPPADGVAPWAWTLWEGARAGKTSAVASGSGMTADSAKTKAVDALANLA